MDKLLGSTLLILRLALQSHACSRAYAEVRSVLCSCTGQNVNATVCTGTLDYAWCTEYVDPTYCGSTGGHDCYVGGAEDGCIDRPFAAPRALSKLIESIDHSIASAEERPRCATANLPSIDEWFAARKASLQKMATSSHGG